jgi:hypothetical protein
MVAEPGTNAMRLGFRNDAPDAGSRSNPNFLDSPYIFALPSGILAEGADGTSSAAALGHRCNRPDTPDRLNMIAEAPVTSEPKW